MSYMGLSGGFTLVYFYITYFKHRVRLPSMSDGLIRACVLEITVISICIDAYIIIIMYAFLIYNGEIIITRQL